MFVCVTLIFGALSVQAEASLQNSDLVVELNTKVYEPLKKAMSLIDMARVVDQHYYTDFEITSQVARDERLKSEFCSRDEDMNLVSSKQLSETWFGIWEKAARQGAQGRKRQQIMVLVDRALLKLQNLLQSEEVRLCVEEFTPAYSDGHKVFFVRLPQHDIEFFFEEGFPD
jgi:hypothetical protein